MLYNTVESGSFVPGSCALCVCVRASSSLLPPQVISANVADVNLVSYRASQGTISVEQVFRAMGIFCSWVSLIRFFEYESRFYVLIIAMRASIVHVGK